MKLEPCLGSNQNAIAPIYDVLTQPAGAKFIMSKVSPFGSVGS